MDPVLIGEILAGTMFLGVIGFLMLGFPVGILAAQNPRLDRVVTLVIDTLQTADGRAPLLQQVAPNAPQGAPGHQHGQGAGHDHEPARQARRRFNVAAFRGQGGFTMALQFKHGQVDALLPARTFAAQFQLHGRARAAAAAHFQRSGHDFKALGQQRPQGLHPRRQVPALEVLLEAATQLARPLASSGPRATRRTYCSGLAAVRLRNSPILASAASLALPWRSAWLASPVSE